MTSLHVYFSLLLISSVFLSGFIWIASEDATPAPEDDWELIPVAQKMVTIGQKLSGLYLTISMPIMLLNMLYIITFCTGA